MSRKYDTQSMLKSFFLFVRTQFIVNIKIMRTDNGFEFLSMKYFFLNNEVELQHSCVYTSQENGVIERKHHHILNVARVLCFQSNLTVVYLINRLPTPLLNKKSPFVCSTTNHLLSLIFFGYLCYAIVVHHHNKFDSHARRCVFLGYHKGQKSYKLYDLDSHHFLVSQDATFHETIFPYAKKHPLPLTRPILPLLVDPSHTYPFRISPQSNPLPSFEPHT